MKIYVDIGFLNFLFDEMGKSILTQEKKKEIVFIDELFRKSKVYLNIADDILTELRTNSSVPNSILDEDTQNIIMFLFNGRHHLILSCKSECEKIKNNIENGNMDFELTADFYFFDGSLSDAQLIEKNTGVYTINKDLDLHESIYRVLIKSIKANKIIDLAEYTNFLLSSKALIIEDPYFYLNTESFIKEIIFSLIKNKVDLNNSISVIILIPDISKISESNIEKYELFRTYINSLNIKFSNIFLIEVKSYVNHKMHDRHIFSNNFWITCGHSFKEQYNTNTEWIYKPIGVYFDEYINRLRFATDYFLRQGIRTDNLLYKRAYPLL